jgi:hypothetical protein
MQQTIKQDYMGGLVVLMGWGGRFGGGDVVGVGKFLCLYFYCMLVSAFVLDVKRTLHINIC